VCSINLEELDMASELAEFVNTIEAALDYVRTKAPEGLGLELDKVDVKISAVKQAKGGAKFEWGPIKLGAETKRKEATILGFELRPRSVSKLGSLAAERLGDAIIAQAQAINEVANLSAFRVNKSSVEVGLEVSAGGEVTVVATGSGESTAAHSIQLSFIPSKT
jgi:hypothetical protein